MDWNKELAKFHGTDKWYATPYIGLLTEGTKFLVEKGNLFYLIQLIELIIINNFQDRTMIFSEFENVDDDIEFKVDDGNHNIIFETIIKKEQLPMDKIRIWSQYWPGKYRWVHMLPGEY